MTDETKNAPQQDAETAAAAMKTPKRPNPPPNPIRSSF